MPNKGKSRTARKRGPQGHQKPARSRRPPQRTPPPGPKAEALTPAQEAFTAAYIANGGNGTRAYLASHPDCTSYGAAGVEAHRALRNPKIRALIDAARVERWKRLEMEGDEAIALLSLRARANIADAFDDAGQLLPVHVWPEVLQLAVKSIRRGKDGDVITLHDGLKAAELMAIATGRLKTALTVNHTFDHVAALAGSDTPPEARP